MTVFDVHTDIIIAPLHTSETRSRTTSGRLSLQDFADTSLCHSTFSNSNSTDKRQELLHAAGRSTESSTDQQQQ